MNLEKRHGVDDVEAGPRSSQAVLLVLPATAQGLELT